jgi:hypothetical protein
MYFLAGSEVNPHISNSYMILAYFHCGKEESFGGFPDSHRGNTRGFCAPAKEI